MYKGAGQVTNFYVLTNIHGQTLGIFTSPQKAMEHVYLTEIYHVYRGYNDTPSRLIWEDDCGVNWYARSPEEFGLRPMHRPAARYEIHIAELDWLVPVENEIRAYAQKFPSQSELMPVVAYGMKAPEG